MRDLRTRPQADEKRAPSSVGARGPQLVPPVSPHAWLLVFLALRTP